MELATFKQKAFIGHLAQKRGLDGWMHAMSVYGSDSYDALTKRGASQIIDWLKSDECLRDIDRRRQNDTSLLAKTAA